MNIVIISSTFPYPPSRGGTEIRTFNLLKYLNSRHHVTLITQRHSGVSDQEVEELGQWVSQLVIFPLPPEPGSSAVGKVGRFINSLVQSTPPNVLHRYSQEMQTWIDQAVEQGKVDVITCEHSVNEIYIRPSYLKQVHTVVNIHSSVVGWTRNHLEMGASPNPRRDRIYLQLLLERYEKRYAAKFHDLVVTTEDDEKQFRQFQPQGEIHVVANGVDLELFPMRSFDPNNHNLVFVGAMDASHNIDAARFFTLEVLPILQNAYADTTFTIIGARPVPEVLQLAKHPGVIVTGGVPRVVDYLHQGTVCVTPLRSGYGIKNKTLEAMAAGVPVVASDRGLEGLAVDGPNNPHRALRANTVAEYVETIGRLFEHPHLREQLSQNGRLLIETEYTWERAGELYEQVLLRR
ncbi:MAG: glycosyltransferase family 4 protein [Planktothrix sp. GU0601_MAG3]|nr:MAG: glycosyltransferase family 4 protein [Planktothrix sp. GU0601_MAG3]